MNHDAMLVRRYAECTAFVLLWMACGFYLPLNPIAYQLLGLPLIAVFQLAVVRRPIAQLWARDADKFTFDFKTVIVASALLLACGIALLSERGRVATGLDARAKLFILIVVAAVPAAFAVRRQRAADLWRALGIVAIAIVIRVGWRVAWAPTWDGATTFPLSKVPDFLTDLICEFVALFLVDEVAFRGALDPHLAGARRGRLHGWSSAVFVSLLWSAWHFQTYHPDAKTFPQLFTQVGPQDFMPVIYGVALSFCARSSRTLVPSTAVHAAGNAYVLTLTR